MKFENKISLIKLTREKMNCGLLEAKHLIEALGDVAVPSSEQYLLVQDSEIKAMYPTYSSATCAGRDTGVEFSVVGVIFINSFTPKIEWSEKAVDHLVLD
jgi:hypothetical protein